VVQISQQLGHSTEMLLSTYAHVISEYANAPKVVPEEEMCAARAGGATHLLPAYLPQAIGEGRSARGNGKPSIGLEPMTPSLPWAHWPGSLIRLMTPVSQDALHIVMNQPIPASRRWQRMTRPDRLLLPVCYPESP